MNKYKFIIFAASALSLVACNKELVNTDFDDEDPNYSYITLGVNTAQLDTRGLTAGEKKINSLDIFIFNGATEDLEISYSANQSELDASKITIKLPVGEKIIYGLANCPQDVIGSIKKTSDLKSIVTYYTESNPENLVCHGSVMQKVTLVHGKKASPVLVLHRICGKVDFKNVSCTYEGVLEGRTVKLLRVFSTFIAKSFPLFQGDYTNCFGTYNTISLNSNEFRSYPYSSTEYYNTALPLDNEVLGMTCYNVPEDMQLLTKEGTNFDQTFYVFPNAATPATIVSDTDSCTKIVMEVSIDGELCYYPITVAYTNPNYSYEIKNVSITLPGSSDPNTHVTKGTCDFMLSLVSWTSASVYGVFNGTTSGGFEF